MLNQCWGRRRVKGVTLDVVGQVAMFTVTKEKPNKESCYQGYGVECNGLNARHVRGTMWRGGSVIPGYYRYNSLVQRLYKVV